MKKFAMTLAAALMVAQPVFANIVALGPANSPAQPINGISLATTGSVTVEGRTHNDLAVVGAGLRTKYKFLKTWNVYVGQFLLPKDAVAGYKDVTEANVLDYVSKQKVAAFNMHVVLYPLSIQASDMKDAFKEGFAANKKAGIIPNTPAMNQTINQFVTNVGKTGSASNGADLQVTWEILPNGQEVVSYANGGKAPVVAYGPQGWAKAVLSVWFGAIDPSDDGLVSMKQQLVHYLKGTL